MEIEKICRTCMGLSGPLLSIYDSNSDCIALMLSGFTKIKPSRGDNLPEKVCLACISEINRCYSFMLKCESSNRTLRQLLPDAAPEEIDVKSEQNRPQQCNKSVQTTVEKNKQVTSTEVQTVNEKTLMVNQQVQTDLEPHRKLKRFSEVLQTENNFKDSMQTAETDLIAETSKDDEKKAELVYKDFQMEDETNDNEIILELLDDGDDKGIPPKQLQKNRKLSAVHYDENAAYIEIEDLSLDYNASSVNEEYDDSAVIHYNKQLKAEQSLNQTVEDHINDEVEEVFLETGGSQEQDYNFTIYDNENGETQVVSRRRLGARSWKVTSPIDAFKCLKCTMKFESEKCLEQHILKKHNWPQGKHTTAEVEEESRDLPVTEKLSNSPTRIKQNETSKDEKKHGVDACINSESEMVKLSYFCERCNAGFALSKSLNYHRQQKTCTMRSFKCEECERVFISENHLKEHRFTHMLGDVCVECHKVFKTTAEFSQHMVDEHKRNLRNQCNVCKKVFTMTSALRDHLRIHSGEKPFLCPVCGKGFSQNANLKQHVKRHTKVKNFQCDECSNSFVTKAELVSHKRRHTGDAPYKCEYCTGSFTTSSSLLKHRRKHTGERPYACDICPMRFSALNVLKNHRRTHTGEKPYKCIYCSKAFTQRGDCQIHQRSHTDQEKPRKSRKAHNSHYAKKFTHLNHCRSTSSKSCKKALNDADTASTSNNNSMHVTIINDDSDISNDDAPVIGISSDDGTQAQSGEEELMQMAIEMC